MRHLVTLLFLIAAGIAYATGIGPLFFGTPLLGSVLIAAGVVFEVVFWRRARRPAHQ
ncbi:glycosyl transferase family 39 [Dyella psychrodurans]|uniref:Glycosyl transferase family 39 n=1 Tax=Dyella psychrodurans TaxID=1927960 RepID=A0A370X051_9GAMM|nr:glycosyl transferase family 39 [Dyella psychrodurans]RDS81794.1 glycosyl transferase family 39 [Dyella psychrodurans]